MYEGLFAGSVPVYRGSLSINKYMPANDSFINANSLSPLELANILKEIGSDEGIVSIQSRAIPTMLLGCFVICYSQV